MKKGGKLIKKEKIKKGIEKLEKITLWQKIKSIEKKHTFWFFSVIIILFILFFFFGTRLYLLFNFLLGHDTVVKLETNNEAFFVKNSEVGKVDFDIYVSTNLFCEAECEYFFEDLSSGYLIDKNNFTTKISNPTKLSYSLVAPELGEGQKLYNFKVKCLSKETGFCKTDERTKERSYLVALNYELNDEQKAFREKANLSLKKLIFDYDELKRIKMENQELYKILSKYILVNNLKSDELNAIASDIDVLLGQWKNYEYESVLENALFEKINLTREILVANNNNLTYTFDQFNLFVSKTDNLRQEIVKLTLLENISKDESDKILLAVNDYNNLIVTFNKSFDLNENYLKLNSLTAYVNSSFNEINQSFNATYIYPELKRSNLIFLSKPFYSNYSSGKTVEPEQPMCCYKGDCEVCCADNCVSDPTKYPIILVHGHSFNEAVSAESSIEKLNNIKDALSGSGVIDGGYVIVKNLEKTGTFARTNKRIAFAVSYYFDIYKKEEGAIVLQTKADSLDTYALRLNDIIENVKTMTHRDKVVIVAHSMGGLVSRRYMQIFGSDSVDKLIMIGTPNNGIDGYVLSSCPVLGASIHCEMMDKESLFINKLNYGEIPNTNVSVIIGLGCSMEGENGDGVVKNSSAFLPWAKDYYVNGTCTGVNFLHTGLIDVDAHPEVYDIIKQELGLNNTNNNL